MTDTLHLRTDVHVEIIAPRQAADLPSAGYWSVESVESSPESLRETARDSRFTCCWAVARVGGVPVGVLPLYRPKGSAFSSSIFDPAVVAPTLFGGRRDRRADEYLLVGGHFELFAGAATAAGLDDESAQRVVTAMVDAAFAHARASGLVAAAIYVRDSQRDGFTGPDSSRRPSAGIDEFAWIPVAGPTDDDYLASLNHGRRSVVRRDWLRLEKLGLRAVTSSALDVVAEAVPLVAAVKRRHDVLDHPRLVEHRLTVWASRSPGPRLAFVVRDQDGQPLAISFGTLRAEVLELYEIGMQDDFEMRGLVYAEVLVYAPMRCAAQAGCAAVSLGLGSRAPKVLRGAQLATVWAVGCD